MAGHHHYEGDFIQEFNFSTGLKKALFGLIGVGALLLVIGLIVAAGHDPAHESHGEGAHESHATAAAVPLLADANSDAAPAKGHTEATHSDAAHAEGHGDGHAAHGGDHGAGHGAHGSHRYGGYLIQRVMINVVQNSFFFLGLGLLAFFFLAIQYATNAGWFTILKRIPESFTRFIPFAWGLLVIVTLIEMAGVVTIHPWTNTEWVESDKLLQSKTWYLNNAFFFVRQFFIVIIWVLLDVYMRRASLAEDAQGGIGLFRRRRRLGYTFILVFALSWSLSSFDWMLSTDPHWFSTMFAVHMFASVFVCALSMITLIAIYLKATGHMPYANAAHFHDLGKFVFGFSIFWTYIWFSQFLLIWYANIPEETMFFQNIMENYGFLFAINLVINFIVPFLGLMTNTSKRKMVPLVTVCSIVFVGHFIDFFLMVQPSVLGTHAHLGLLEIGMYLMFLGVFLFMGFRALSKTPLIAKKHPYLQESLLHYY